MTRRDLFSLVSKVGIVAAAQMVPWKLLESFGLVEDYLAEAAILPQNYRVRDAQGMIWDASSGIASIVASSTFGPGSWTMEDNTDQQYIKTPGGTKSIRVQVDGTLGLTAAFLDIVLDDLMLTNIHQFGLHYYSADVNGDGKVDIGEIGINLGNTTNYSSNYLYTFHNLLNTQSEVPGWSFGQMVKTEFNTATGTPSLDSPFVRLRLRVAAPAGGKTDIYVDSLLYNFYCRPCVVFTFDDNNLTQYTEAFAYMQPRKVPGAVAFTAINFGSGSHVSEAQMNEMLDAGWSIHSHGYTHPHYINMGTQAEMENDIQLNRDFLRAHGWDRNNSFVYPYAEYNALLRQAIVARGYPIGVHAGSITDKLYPGIIQPLRIPRWTFDGLSSATMIANTSKAIRRGEACIVLIHHVGTGGGPTQADFRAYVDWCVRMRDSNVLDILNLEDYITRFTSPRVRR